MERLCLLRNFNKYYNRTIKRVSNTLELADYDKVILENINFNFNDYVETEQIINWDEAWLPDYLVLLDEGTGIKQRWFVLEADKVREKQYNLKLRRDLVADDYDSLQNCVANIDRCIVPSDNPLIFNKEPFEYNQIKKGEIQLYDRTSCPWIIGYMDNEASIDYTGDHAIVLSEDFDVDLSNTTYEDWTYHNLVTQDIKNNVRLIDTAVTISWDDWWGSGIIGGKAYQNQTRSWYNAISGQVGTNNEAIRYSESNFNTVKNEAHRYMWYNWNTCNQKLLENETETNVISNTDLSNLRALNGCLVKFSNGIYRINFTANGSRDVTRNKQDNSLATYVLNCFQSQVSGSKKHNYLDYTYRYDRYYLTATPVTSSATSSLSFSMTTGTNKLKDAPYRMFAIPLPNIQDAPGFTVKYLGDNKYTCNKDMILTLVQHLIVDLGDHLFDIQLLPYCPVEFEGYSFSENVQYADMPVNGGVGRWVKNVDYDEIIYTAGGSSLYEGIVVYPKESSFKFTIEETVDTKTSSKVNINDLFPITDKKIQNETEFVRFCSPNYASAFEFSPAKNGGIKSVNVACTYKPFNPFILVAPQFDELYGKDYSDNRGLVLAGDYSLAQISDKWIEFQIQNKSYAEAFKREIINMEREYNIQREEAGWQIAAGTVTGAASGALTGGVMSGGNPYAAAAGAIVGGATSLVGGILDYNNLEKRQTEAINYKKDLFNFQLQNIKAQPDTLEKTSSINANSKYVPYIENYDCTEQEKNLLKAYIQYNGMTAGFVGPINMTGFVRANIIRYFGDYGTYELNELNNELMKGVYL